MLRFACLLGVAVLLLSGVSAGAQGELTVERALRVPYGVSLSASPAGEQFAWVEVEQGRHNLWLGGPGLLAHPLTGYSEDDGQDIRDLTWLPDGQSIAYTRGSENGADGKPANPAHRQPPPATEVWLLRTGRSGGSPQLVGEGHTPLALPDGGHLLFVRSGQIWITGVAPTGPSGSAALGDTPPPAPRQLVFDRGSASQLAVAADGTSLAFISRRDHTHSFVALFDLRSHTLSFPAASTGNDSAPVFSPDGRQLAWLRAPWTDAPEFAANRTSANPWSIQMLDLASGRVRTVYAPPPNQPGSVLPHMSSGEPRLMWSDTLPGQAEGPALLFASEADGWVHLYGLPADAPAGTKPILLTPLPGEVEDPVLSPDRKLLLYTSRGPAHTCSEGTVCTRDLPLPGNTDRRTIWRLDLAGTGAAPSSRSSPAIFPLPLTPPSQIAVKPVIASDGTAAALVSDAHTPMQPALLSAVAAPAGNLDRVEPAKPLGRPPAFGDAPAEALVTPEGVLFPSADRLFTLHGQLFLPAAKTGGKGIEGRGVRRPALLFFHGGPRRQMLLGFPAMEYYEHAYALNEYFASRGFLVLSVNYRRGIGYGTDFREAANTGADGALEYNDVLGAVAYLRSRPDVDPARIGLWGGSYGGYLTALGLARNSDLFAAGVDFHGVHDWILEDNRSEWLRGTAAEQEKIATRAHRSSPLADLDKWKSPVLLIHGDNDANVAYAQSPVLADALRARDVRVEELIFPDEIHEFLLYRDWLAAYKATAEFLERELKP